MSTKMQEVSNPSLKSSYEEKGSTTVSSVEPAGTLPSAQLASTTEFYFFPIPKHLRYCPEKPFKFTWSVTVVYAVASMILTGNLYYCQPLLIAMSKTFDVSYERVSRIPTCVQAGFAVSLFLICPLGDIVRRRQLVLALVFITTFLTIGLAVTKDVVIFEALSFIMGLANAAPQILAPLVAETAPLEKRAFVFSIILTGTMFGILLARVIAGVIGEFVVWRTVYYAAVGFQAIIFGGLYFTLPDHPSNRERVPYWKIHWTMAVLAVTEPVAVQVIIITIGASAGFAYYWVTLTFLLGGPPYHYSTLEIGLFGLIGMAGVAAGPLSGRIVDRILPWHSLLASIIFLLIFQAIQMAAGGIHIAAVIVSCFGLDLFQQIQNVALPNYIFSISQAAISRLNALYMISVGSRSNFTFQAILFKLMTQYYVGQMIGTSAGTKIFIQYGWRASAAFGMAVYMMQLGALLLRGPNCRRKTWFGYEGGIGMRPLDSNESKISQP